MYKHLLNLTFFSYIVTQIDDIKTTHVTKKTPSKKHYALDAKKSSPWMRQHPIGDALRDSYNAVLNEPVPEKFKSLMEMMRKAETKR